MQLAPIAKGMIAGEKAGLTSDLILWEHTRDLDYDILEGEYLVGFGAGFVKGQQHRELMKLVQNGLSLDELTSCYKSILDQWRHPAFRNPEKFLANIEDWNNYTLPASVVSESLTYWEVGKFQRSLARISSFYFEELRLQSAISFEELCSDLQDIRTAKRKKLITTEAYYLRLSGLKCRLDNWLHAQP